MKFTVRPHSRPQMKMCIPGRAERGGPSTLSVKKGEEMDSASCTMHGDLVFPGIDTTKAERW